MNEEETKWYAVYTKPRWEKKVAETLTDGKIENYCPLNKVTRKWSDRKKIVTLPLFSSYVFVHITKNQFIEVKKTNGVLSFVTWLGKPAIIRDVEIETIKRFLNEHEFVHLEKTKFHVHDNVRITQGTFMNNEGKVVSIKNNFICVELPSLGFSMLAEISRQSLAKIHEPNL